MSILRGCRNERPALDGEAAERTPRDQLMRLLPRGFWGQKWGQNPGRSKPSKTMRWRIHWAVEERGAVQACRWQRSNPYLSAILKEAP